VPRIAVVGLGHMGLSALKILRAARSDASFSVFDRSAQALDRATALGDNVDGQICDVSEAVPDLRAADVVLNLAGPFFAASDVVARAALASGTTYVDVGDDLEATETILGLDLEAKQAGIALITGAGLSPGVSNWMACRLLDEYPQADGIQIAWATNEPDPGGLAPLRHMLHMAVTPCPVWRDGAWDQSPGFVPSTAASFDFPEPLGNVEAYDTSHPEPLTLSRHFPRLRFASCKGALRPDWANSAFSTLGRIGFGYTDVTVDINGTAVEPAEFLWKMMWARYERRPAERRGSTSAVLVQALSGAEVLGALAITDGEAMARGTGLGAAVAVLAALDAPPAAGAWGPEVLPWTHTLPLFERLAAGAGGFDRGVIEMAAAPSGGIG
jgi:lysine 6-dehydrogenase